MATIVLVDDHPMFRDSIAAVITSAFPEEKVLTAGSGDEALSLIEKESPDVFITDLGLGHENGLDLLHTVKKRFPYLRMMVLTMHDGLDFLRKALQAGATGYITKGSDTSTLSEAVRSVLKGNFFFDQLILEQMVNYIRNENLPTPADFRLAELGLTEREQQIFYQLIQTPDMKKVSEKLFISPKTVENHRANIYRKLNVKGRHALLQFAHREGLLPD